MPTPVKLKQGTNYYQPICYFPIGYIYLSTSNVNPGQFFGGTWKQIKDRFLLLAGNTYKGGQTGGEATHKLTIDEMPSHTHSLPWATQYQFGFNYARIISSSLDNVTEQLTNDSMYSAGGNQAHNNMPPYIVVYGWVKVSN